MEMMYFRNRPLEKRFEIFQKLVNKGWRIELEKIDQFENCYWRIDEITKLPVPNQIKNRFGDIPPQTWSTYVYSPNAEDYLDDLYASFNTPIEAYEWLAPRIERYANEN